MARGQNKEQILNSGLKLMYKQGFNASGVQEIAKVSGVPKGSFYNYFKSKEDFVIQALERYTENISTVLEKTLIQGEGSPLTRLNSLFRDWGDNQFCKYEGSGCFVGNLSQEMANINPTVRVALDQAFNKLLSYYTACLKEAQEVGEIDRNIDPEKLASFIYNAWQGALIRSKAEGNTEALTLFQEVVFGKLLT